VKLILIITISNDYYITSNSGRDAVKVTTILHE